MNGAENLFIYMLEELFVLKKHHLGIGENISNKKK